MILAWTRKVINTFPAAALPIAQVSHCLSARANKYFFFSLSFTGRKQKVTQARATEKRNADRMPKLSLDVTVPMPPTSDVESDSGDPAPPSPYMWTTTTTLFTWVLMSAFVGKYSYHSLICCFIILLLYQDIIIWLLRRSGRNESGNGTG